MHTKVNYNLSTPVNNIHENDSPVGYSASDRSCPIIDELLARDRTTAFSSISGIAMEDFSNRYLYTEDLEYLERILWESTRQPYERRISECDYKGH
ncbi:uncharacterized protein LOC111250876 isoform X2 [Varroa destructor]|uniref:Uncharacterized protein n=1 Tax=Varroa destructor TaxID=109461 RepID=A0A7M7K6U7_VARDE|nr:uncharacterized protein LOC111250876 isoform X2 [Varroa destructor]